MSQTKYKSEFYLVLATATATGTSWQLDRGSSRWSFLCTLLFTMHMPHTQWVSSRKHASGH